ncbi:MAG: ATP-binding protein [Symbiobacteriia bacterium]
MRNREGFLGAAEQKAYLAVHDLRRELGVPERDIWDKERQEWLGEWTCPRCQETVRVVVTNDSPWGESRVFPRCRCQRELYEQTCVAEVQAGWADVSRDHWQDAEIPPHFIDATLANFKVRPGTEKAVEVCRIYADAFKIGETAKGLYLAGPVGTGKTHLMAATARAIVEASLVRVKFVGVAALINRIKSGTEERPFDFGLVDHAVKTELLLFDDLGTGNMTPFAQDVVYQVVDGRYQANKPLLVTSNLGDTQLKQQLGDRIVDRLFEMTKLVKVDGTSYRKELAKSA